VSAEYQFIVPDEAVAPRTTVPVPQREPGVVPVIVPDGLTVTERAEEPGLDPQPLTAVTEIVPPLALAVAVMDMVPLPAVMVQPAGSVQLYDDASGTAAIL
jgi:hypothetical protein